MLILLVGDPTLGTMNLDEHVPLFCRFPTIWGGRQGRWDKTVLSKAQGPGLNLRQDSPEPSCYCSLHLPASTPPHFFYSFSHRYSHWVSRTSNPWGWLLCTIPLQTTFSTCLDLLWRHASQKQPQGEIRLGKCTHHHPL